MASLSALLLLVYMSMEIYCTLLVQLGVGFVLCVVFFFFWPLFVDGGVVTVSMSLHFDKPITVLYSTPHPTTTTYAPVHMPCVW